MAKNHVESEFSPTQFVGNGCRQRADEGRKPQTQYTNMPDERAKQLVRCGLYGMLWAKSVL